MCELHDCGSKGDDVESWEQTEDEGEYKLDADFRCALFGALLPLRARHLGVRPQRLRNARTESIGLDEHGDKRTHVVDLGTRSEVLECL